MHFIGGNEICQLIAKCTCCGKEGIVSMTSIFLNKDFSLMGTERNHSFPQYPQRKPRLAEEK